MRKFILLGSALLLGFGMNVASAQQLPNVGFKSWKATSDMGKTYYLGLGAGDEDEDKYKPRPANDKDKDNVVTEPAGWNGSNVDQMGAKGFFVGKEVEETGNVAVELKNDFVGMFGFGDNAPGFITFATPWVYSEIPNLKNCDGGVFGGVEFTFKPDAIKGKFKYAKGEGDAPETSHVIAYLWNGTFTSKIGSKDDPTEETNDVDRAIMRPKNAGTVSGNGKLVASCDHEITSTKDGDWEEILIPLDYEEGAGEPEKMNVIISAADYWNRSSIQAGTTLWVDDVDFVYYSTLTSLEVGGAAVLNFAADKYAYDMGIVTALPAAESISAVAKSPRANVEVTVDEAAWQVRIVVTNQGGMDLDGETSHTYTLQYEKPETTEYAGYLNIDMAGMPLTYNADATVRIVDYKDGTCDFILPEFTLNGSASLGDITVPEATMTEDASGVKTFEGLVPEMSLTDGKIEIKARVELNGTIDAEGKADFDVDVAWLNGGSEIPIAVTFTSDMVGEELGGYYYIVENGDYENPVEEKTQVTLASYPVGSAGDVAYRLVLSDVNYGGATADIVVEGIGMTEATPEVTYTGEATNVALPDGTVAEKVAVDGGTTDGVHYEIKFTMTVDGSESVIGFTTEPVTSGVDGVAAGEVAVYGADGAIVVDGFGGEVAVYAADGQLVKSAAVDGHAEIAVAGGLYVVRAGEAVKKVIVK